MVGAWKAAPGARIWRAYMYTSWLGDLDKSARGWGWWASSGGGGATFRGGARAGGF